MSITVEGTIQKSSAGAGTWVLVTPGGQSYEIYRNAPQNLLQSGQKVRVQGTVHPDGMTVAMIGPVLEVHAFEVMN